MKPPYFHYRRDVEVCYNCCFSQWDSSLDTDDQWCWKYELEVSPVGHCESFAFTDQDVSDTEYPDEDDDAGEDEGL
ncbi:MAG: hypothetical protein BWY93_01478 [Euryarchaeota archaeon ADurb.BinA087]|nr:MAG: hypothetical protein BWY93_01478 [Euryarchaeota archaeon ADurb.BinA087]